MQHGKIYILETQTVIRESRITSYLLFAYLSHLSSVFAPWDSMDDFIMFQNVFKIYS